MPDTIWLDGRLVSVTQPKLNALSPGLMKGAGVFETLRVYDGQTPFLKEHLKRLQRGIETLRLDNPYPISQIVTGLKSALKESHFKKAKIRILVWQNKISHAAVVVQIYRPYKSLKYRRGLKIVISNDKLDKKFPLSQIKSIDYALFKKALNRAQRQGFDEALLLNKNGTVVEGTRSNIFWFKQNVLHTPALPCGCLPGITRSIVIKLARKLNWQVREVKTEHQDLYTAQEIFVTNSLMEIMPVTKIGLQKIGKGSIGPKTRKLQRGYRLLLKNYFK